MNIKLKRMVTILFIFLVVPCISIPIVSAQDTDDDYSITWSFNQIQSALKNVKIYYGSTLVSTLIEGQMTYNPSYGSGYYPLKFQMTQPFLVDSAGDRITAEQATVESTYLGQKVINGTIIQYYRYGYGVDFLAYTIAALDSSKIPLMTKYMNGWTTSDLNQEHLHKRTLPDSNQLLVLEQVAPESVYLDHADNPINTLDVNWWYGYPGTVLGKAGATPYNINAYDWEDSVDWLGNVVKNPYDSIIPTHMELSWAMPYSATSINMSKLNADIGLNKQLKIVPEIAFSVSPLSFDTLNINGTDVEVYAALEQCTTVRMSLGQVRNIDANATKYEDEVKNQQIQEVEKESTTTVAAPSSNSESLTKGSTAISTSVNVESKPGISPQTYLVAGVTVGSSLPMYVPTTSSTISNASQVLSLRTDETRVASIKPELQIQPTHYIDSYRCYATAKRVAYRDPWQIWTGSLVYSDATDLSYTKDVDITGNVQTGVRVYNNYIIQRFKFNVIISTIVNTSNVFVPDGTDINDPDVLGGTGISINPPGGATGTLVTPEEVLSPWDAWNKFWEDLFSNPVNTIIFIIIIVVVVIALIAVIYFISKLRSPFRTGSVGNRNEPQKVEVTVKVEKEGTSEGKKGNDGTSKARCSRDPSRTLL